MCTSLSYHIFAVFWWWSSSAYPLFLRNKYDTTYVTCNGTNNTKFNLCMKCTKINYFSPLFSIVYYMQMKNLWYQTSKFCGQYNYIRLTKMCYCSVNVRYNLYHLQMKPGLSDVWQFLHFQWDPPLMLPHLKLKWLKFHQQTW